VYKKLDEIISPHSHVIINLKKKINKGILIPNFPIVKPKIEQSELNYLSRNDIFCYSGTVYSYSNQEIICEALMYLKKAKYKIAGYIEENHKIKILNSEAKEQIEFVGRLNQNELANFYSNSIAGLVIYDYKLNLGNKVGSYGTNKLFEYMESGIPIICTDYDLWRDIVDRYKCGIYVKPGDTYALKNAMIKIINDKKSSFEMGQNGRHAVETEFNWKFTEKDYINLYHKISKK
jgi:glycosyltransferase involved in cell wall biosynthesis